MLPEIARYDHILGLPKDRNLGEALVAAMKAIEAATVLFWLDTDYTPSSRVQFNAVQPCSTLGRLPTLAGYFVPKKTG